MQSERPTAQDNDSGRKQIIADVGFPFGNIQLSSNLEGTIARTDALVQTTIGRLSRSYPEQDIGGAALGDLQQIRPHLQEALATLSQIEERRKLTDKELSYRRAFKMLSEATR